MKSIIYILILFMGSIVTAQEFIIDNNKSSLIWTGKAAYNAYSLTGSLNAKSGNIIIAKDSIKKFEITVDMKSLHHKNRDLKSHLRSKDFFEVKKFTEAFFYITSPVKFKIGENVIEGKMKIKDKIKLENIILRIDASKNLIKITFNTKINRLEYGVTFNSPSVFKKLKENAIADEFDLKGELFFIPNK